jgi:hypothetical protein
VKGQGFFVYSFDENLYKHNDENINRTIKFVFFVISISKTAMNQRPGITEGPVSYAYGYESRNNSNKFTP